MYMKLELFLYFLFFDNDLRVYNHYYNDFLDKIYPVGAVYISVNDVNPSTLFGGTWERIEQGRFLVSAGTNYSLGSTGGSGTHSHSTGDCTLTTDQIPAHTHGNKEMGGWVSNIMGQKNAGCDGALKWTPYNSFGELQSGNGTYAKTPGEIKLQSWHEHDSVGGNQAHNHGDTGSSSNIPPYLSVNIWKRTK